MSGTPLLLLGNKNDLPNALGAQELADYMELQKITDRPVGVFSVSAKCGDGMERTIEWLTKHGR